MYASYSLSPYIKECLEEITKEQFLDFFKGFLRHLVLKYALDFTLDINMDYEVREYLGSFLAASSGNEESPWKLNTSG